METLQTRQDKGPGTEQNTGVYSFAQPRDRQGRETSDERQQNGLNEEGLARGLGWFSIGLGIAELAAPRDLARSIGVSDHRLLLRAVGLREIVTGLGILTRRRPAGWLWARVAGDMMDLALLGTVLNSADGRRGRVTAATAAVAGVTMLDVWCSRQISRSPDAEVSGIPVKKSITVNRPPEELYRFWHDFQNLPRFMNHLISVQVNGERRSHWVAKGPAGTSVEWDAEVINDKPDELIEWRSLEGADVDNSGSVRFERAPGGRGTVVRVEMEYNPPAGVIGATVAKLFGEAPEKQVKVDLLRFKQLMETGEIARTEGQPAGRARSTSKKYDDFLRK
jgi:uncharacterized membrane protein